MATLEGTALGHLGAQKAGFLSLRYDLEAEVFSRILILFDRPVSVLLIQDSPVIINIFIEVHLLDLELV